MFPISLKAVEQARTAIAPYIHPTPLLSNRYLNQVTGKELLLKCETFQITGSFKIRGACHCILQQLPKAKENGVIAASAGNHGQGVAATCQFLGISGTIVMPESTPAIKVLKTEKWGASVELKGRIYDESYDHARKLASENEALFVHPFKDPHVVAGQGTLALELCEAPEFKDVQAIVVSVGGGGLISGLATVLREKRPDLKIYGVTAKNAPATWQSFKKQAPVPLPVTFTLADGVAVKNPDALMLDNLVSQLDNLFCIEEDRLAYAISLLAEHGKLVVEGAGGLPMAAVLSDLIPEERVALVLSGGNVDIPALSKVLQRGMVEQHRLVHLIITVLDRPGALHSITKILAETQANILQVFHQRNTLNVGMGEAVIEVDLETRGQEHTQDVIDELSSGGFHVERVY